MKKLAVALTLVGTIFSAQAVIIGQVTYVNEVTNKLNGNKAVFTDQQGNCPIGKYYGFYAQASGRMTEGCWHFFQGADIKARWGMSDYYYQWSEIQETPYFDGFRQRLIDEARRTK